MVHNSLKYGLRGRFQRAARIDTDLTSDDFFDGYVWNDSIWEVVRQTFQHINSSPQRAFTWTGPFGSGKSSLALLIASLLGTDSARRRKAENVLGEDALKFMFSRLPRPTKGWLIVPIIGRRDTPEVIVHEALKDAVDQRWGRRKPKGLAEALEDKSSEGLFRALSIAGTAAARSGDGLILIIDELGKILEGVAEADGDLQFFQDLAETFSRSKTNCITIGILHQSFQEYAPKIAQLARNEWNKVQGRFVDVPFSVSIEDVATLVGNAIDGPKPGSEVRKLCARFTEALNHPRYSNIKDFDLILANAWPLHPMSTILLGPLSKRRFSQNERSIFSFLASSEPAGFRSFLVDAELATEAPCYEPHKLWDYLQFNLEPAILASADGHRWSEAAEAVERAYKLKNPFAAPLTKLIGLIEVFGRQFGITATEEVLFQSFDRQSKSKISTALKEIKKASIAIYRAHLQAWGLYAGSDIDLDQLIGEASARLGTDIASMARVVPVVQPTVAKRHYHQTGTLRWYDFRIAAIDELESGSTLSKVDSGQTGSFVLLLPTKKLRAHKPSSLGPKLVRKHVECGHLISIGVPHGANRLIDSIRLTASLERVSALTPELEGDQIARRELVGRLNAARETLRQELDNVIETADWYSPNQKRPQKGSVGLTRLASDISDDFFHSSPIVVNELINRNKPSSAAVAARRTLLYQMVAHGDANLLNISGHPAEYGLYKSLLEITTLHQQKLDDGQAWYFGKPSDQSPRSSSYLPLWEDFQIFVTLAEGERLTFQDLYDRWRQPPFGLAQGVLPILALAHVLAFQDELALYLDGVFSPTIDDFFVDRLLQSPTLIELQRFRISSERRKILRRIADVVAHSLRADKLETPLDIAKPLAKFAYRLHPWVKKTKRLDAEALAIRDVLLSATDPNTLLFIDLPRACGLSEDIGENTPPKIVDQVVKKLRRTIATLESAQARMLESLAETISTSFGLQELNHAEIADLAERSDLVAGLSGDLRLDAFARRLATDQSRVQWLEGLGGLVANKPVRDWTDADLDRAKVEIVGLVRRFVRIEKISLARRNDPQTLSINGAIGHDGRAKEIDIAVPVTQSSKKKVSELGAKLDQILNEESGDDRLKLAAVVSLLFRLVPEQPEPAKTKRKRRSAIAQ